MKNSWLLLVAAVLLNLAFCPAVPAEDDAKTEAEKVVAELYSLVTMEPGMLPDWDAVRPLFLDEAVVVLRSSRTAMTVFDLEGWIQDFKDAIDKWDMSTRGFEEKLLRMKTLVFGDIAHCFAVYRAGFMSDENLPTNVGVDSIQLIRREGKWLIVSIVNEVELPGVPLPDELK